MMFGAIQIQIQVILHFELFFSLVFGATAASV